MYVKMAEKISKTRLKKGVICKLLKSKRVIKCYDKRGDLIGLYVVKKKKK